MEIGLFAKLRSYEEVAGLKPRHLLGSGLWNQLFITKMNRY